MRNLRNIRYSTWRSPVKHKRQITAAAWDAGNDSVICTYGPSESDTLIELVRVDFQKGESDPEVITSWHAPCPNPDLACDKILSLQYFGDTLTACVVLAGGDIVVIREEPQNAEEQIEIVGSVDAGISAAKWSPDEDLLAICTDVDTFVFMSRSFDGVMDVAMTSDDLKASNHVSVGWGKKETQFQGKGAKALRDPTIPEKVDQGVLSPDDDGRTGITWRGDGAYVAVCTIEAGSRRIIRVYSREGVLDSVSEPVDGLESALAWRPAGNLIAGIQRFSDHIDVVFFERNGLRHGQFRLRLSSDELTTVGKHIQLSWNIDSSALAVILNNRVQLWTMGNYHWYLKQELLTSPEKLMNVQQLIWHPEVPLRFLVGDIGQINVAEYVFSVARGSTAPPNDHGAVAVIDGKDLKITPFRSANVPPPMAMYEITVPGNISDVVFNYGTPSIAILHQSGIAIYSWDINSTTSSLPVLTASTTFKNKLEYPTPQQICFQEDGDILTLHQFETRKHSLRKYGIGKKREGIEEKTMEAVTFSSPSMILSFYQEGSTHSFAQGSSGILLSLSPPSFGQPLVGVSFPTFLPWVEVIAFENQKIAFGMSKNGHLYANSRLLVKNCTSFLVTPLHLILTTTAHVLKFVHIAKAEDLEIPADDPEVDERCRSIERGARLVTGMPTSLSLVLQMPRGNLETIWPRAMVLAGIRKLVDESNYKKAFSHCRTQRVDMNILYDHSPEQFMANVGSFVDQVKKVTYIDLFLSSLREEDVSQTMYKETRRDPKLQNGGPAENSAHETHHFSLPQSSSKVNRICDAVLEVLKARTATNLQNIITANVCKSPPALEDGLLVVAGLMAESDTLAEKAVEHICFLADTNKLYDTSLGLYNLDLALLVAQQSQKDPREYLPFLQKLQEMSVLRRQFSIDDQLGRHSKALSHLYELSKDDHSELEAYIVKHALYQDALALYRYQPLRINSIMSLYASHLESHSRFREAAIAYEYLHLYGPASTCYQRASASHWRESLFCATQQTPPVSDAAFASLASTLAESLTEAKDYESAAAIHTAYLFPSSSSSIPTAITLLCKGHHFASALQLASLHSQSHPDLLLPGGAIDTGLTDALSTTTELLAECKAQLLAQVPRIRDLRTKASADPLAFYSGGGDDDDNNAAAGFPDDISIAPSTSGSSTHASLFTRYTSSQGTTATGTTHKTSKHRRREERKRARGKKGSVYEEEYLVASVARLIQRVEGLRGGLAAGDVARLVVALLRRGMREQARAVEGLCAEVVGMCEAVVRGGEVFGFPGEGRGEGEGEGKEGGGGAEESGIGTGIGTAAGTGEEGGSRLVGGDAVLAESMEAMGKRKPAPYIGTFEKLSLLSA